MDEHEHTDGKREHRDRRRERGVTQRAHPLDQ